jgi:hypothetical protein
MTTTSSDVRFPRLRALVERHRRAARNAIAARSMDDPYAITDEQRVETCGRSPPGSKQAMSQLPITSAGLTSRHPRVCRRKREKVR